jgi:hypothetical protein
MIFSIQRGSLASYIDTKMLFFQFIVLPHNYLIVIFNTEVEGQEHAKCREPCSQAPHARRSPSHTSLLTIGQTLQRESERKKQLRLLRNSGKSS